MRHVGLIISIKNPADFNDEVKAHSECKEF